MTIGSEAPAVSDAVAAGDSVAAFERARAAAMRAKRLQAGLGGLCFLAALAASIEVGEVSLAILVDGLPGFGNYLNDIAPRLRGDHLAADLAEWYWDLGRWLGLLWDTVLIAFVGTLLGIAGALLLCFPASGNLQDNRWIYFAARRLAEVARAVPELVYALIFVFAFGLGPLAGALAIAVHSAGALAKLFSEVNENVAPGPIEGVRAAGGGWLQGIRYGVIPQVLPDYLSYGLLRFEINVRSASVIGFVGAGGIGQELMFVIREFIYTDVSAIVVLILLTVSIIDISCERLRHRLIGREVPA